MARLLVGVDFGRKGGISAFIIGWSMLSLGLGHRLRILLVLLLLVGFTFFHMQVVTTEIAYQEFILMPFGGETSTK